jgi:hypothetical protein
MTDCERTRESLAELVRGDALEAVRAHARACDACREVVDGAAAMKGELDGWRAPPPPADLVERTLAKLAVAAMAPAVDLPPGAPAPEGVVIPFPTMAARPRRRSSVEILTSAPFAEPLVAPTRRQLAFRVVTQAAAALLLFGVCTTFVAVFYPAAVHAIEQRRMSECQERLRRVADALRRYRRDRPDAPALRGPALRLALTDGGYLREEDLVCAGPRGADLGTNSFVAELPAGAVAAERPVCWDRFGNHAEGFNVVYGDGRIEVVAVEDLARWMRRGGSGQ